MIYGTENMRPLPGDRYPHGGLHGQIVHAIGRQIVSGAVRPGEVLSLPEGLPASRTVLREAIKVLAAKGLVESRPKTGTRVRAPQSWNQLDPDVLAWRQEGRLSAPFLRNLSEVRRIIEPAAAELAATRAGASGVAAIADAFADMERAVQGAPVDGDVFVEADMRFHRAILEASGNDILEQMSSVVFPVLVMSFRATSRPPGRARASVPKHRAILDAIREGDPKRAGRAMRRVVGDAAREIEALLRRRRP